MKYIFYILFLIITSYSYASENSCVGVSGKLTYYTERYKNNRILSTDVGLWYNFNIKDEVTLTPYGGVKTWFVQNDYLIYGGNPFRDSYYIGLNLEWYKINFILDHYCEHPVYSGDKQWSIFNTYYENDKICTEMSSLTKGSIVYNTNISQLNIKLILGKALESNTLYETIEIEYPIQIFKMYFDFKIIPYLKYSLWTKNDRNIFQIGAILNWKEIDLTIEYYKTNRNRYHKEIEHLYDEYPLQSKIISISVQYKLN